MYLCIGDMEAPLVSVIMPTFNSGRFLEESIESIIKQTYEKWELLITDDGSTDRLTKDILSKFAAQDERIKIVELDTNKGPGYARNNAIERAKGQYIAFCDSDDKWLPNKLHVQIAFMKEKACALSYGSYIICDIEGKTKGLSKAPQRITLSMLKRDNKIGCSTAMIDLHKLGKKPYMPNLLKRQDWAFFLSILKDSQTPAYGISQPIAIYRKRKNSISSKKLELIKYNIIVYEKILDYHPLYARLYFLLFFLPTHFLKIIKRKYDSHHFIKIHST